MIKRQLSEIIPNYIDFQKAILLKGARQVGKTTLIEGLLGDKKDVLWVNGDNPQMRNLWSDITKENLQLFITDYNYIVIDEAQRIGNIGLATKMIIDMKLNKQVILSGSSSISLSSSINEPLTGRKWTFELFPLSWQEIVAHNRLMPVLQQLETILIFGLYPEIYNIREKKSKRLKELASSYLYKDILELADIRKPEILSKLLQALAYQVGSEVSYHELANMLKVSQETVVRYIDLLEESYVIYRLSPLSVNPRKEISTSRKIYFYDNGVLNAIINNFAPLASRNDIGLLFENFIITEMIKKNKNDQKDDTFYFWRSKSNSEIDLIKKSGNDYHAYEIKYNPRKKGRFTPSFVERYKPTEMHTINSDNFYHFL